MAVAFQWSNQQNNSIGSQVASINVGSTQALGSNGAFTAGFILIAQVVVEAAVTISPPAGWNAIGSQVAGSSSYTTGWWWHLCDGSETGSFTFTWTGNNFFGWTLNAYSGCAASPIDAFQTTSAGSAGSTSQTTGSIMTTNAGDMLVLFLQNDGAALTLPADMTSRYSGLNQEGGTILNYLGDRFPGSSGNFTETFTTPTFHTNSWGFIALLPGGAAVVSTPGILGLASAEW